MHLIKKKEIKKEEVNSEYDLEFDDNKLFGIKKKEEVQEEKIKEEGLKHQIRKPA